MTSETLFPQAVYSLENFVQVPNLDQFSQYLEIASALNISLLVLEGTSINERHDIISKFHSYNLIELSDILEEDPTYKHAILTNDWSNLTQAFFHHFRRGHMLLSSRLTITSSDLEAVKRSLNKNRHKYEIISIHSDSDKVLKWAAHDRRVDYIIINPASNTKVIDKGLCSLMKQHKKQFEIVLSSLIRARNDRELSELIRVGKRVIELLKAHKNDFILTMGVSSPYEFRTRTQLRHIARILGLPYNCTKAASFHNPLSNLIRNHIKLSSSYLFEGAVQEDGNN